MGFGSCSYGSAAYGGLTESIDATDIPGRLPYMARVYDRPATVGRVYDMPATI